MECPSCGAEIAEKDGLCEKCGAQIVLTYACPSCGADLAKGDQFCSECGQEIHFEEAPLEPPTPRTQTFSAAPARERRRRPSIVVGLMALMVLSCSCLICGGSLGGAYYKWQPGSKPMASQPALRFIPAPSSVFEVVSQNSWVDENGDLNIVGEVRNISGQPIENRVSTDVAIFDERGQPIEANVYVSLYRPRIGLNAKSPFHILILGDELIGATVKDVAAYQLGFELTKLPRNEVELRVIDSTVRSDEGSLVVEGQIVNHADRVMTNPRVYVVLYDLNEQVLTTFGLDQVESGRLGPGATSYFEVDLLDPYEETETYDIIATGVLAE